ncbi:uncharacterized protein LOC135463738 [Liolophura sinensis]|uniref:uncharacterized protein LOC135463738 n=1 Tax=Liolophura sinensis TaxID=3198878 RepID=UPI00315828D4
MALNPDCPVCRQNGLQGKLQRFHINFEESITLCANKKCTYPLGLVKTDDLIRKPESLKREVSNGKRAVSNADKIHNSSGIGNTVTKNLSPWRGKTGPHISRHKVCGGYTPGLFQKNIVPVTLAEVELEDRRTPNQGQIRTCDAHESGTIPAGTYKTAASVHNATPAAGNLPSGNGTQMKANYVMTTSVKKSSIHSVKLNGFDVQSSAETRGSRSNDGRCNRRANSGRGGKLPVRDYCNAQQNDVKGEDVDVLSKWYIQWENRDALCWLDVVLCLLVQSRSVKTAVDLSLKTSSGTEPETGKTYIVRTLLAAYDQAMALSKSLCTEREKLKIVPKSEGGETLTRSVSSGVWTQDRFAQQQEIKPAKDTKIKDKGMSWESHAEKESKKQVFHLSRPIQSISNGGVPLKMGAGQIHSPNLASWAEIMVRDPGFRKARSILNCVREQVWQVLQPKLQCEKGRKDSPVFAIPLLLHSDSDICHLFETTYKFETKCSECGDTKIERYTKVLPTLPKVVEDFSMYNVSHWRDCFFCSAPNQKRQLHFEKLSQCVMIHFVEGLPSSDLTALHFSLSGQSYQVSSVVQYKSDPSHFVIWIKHPSGDFWMECDDLEGPLSKFEGQTPNLPAGQIHVVFWERTSADVQPEIDKQPFGSRQKQPLKSLNLRSRKKAAVLESSEDISGTKEPDVEGSATKKPVPTDLGERNFRQDNQSTTAAKAIPPVAVRKTFALLKQMKSSKTCTTSSTDVSRSRSRTIGTAGVGIRPCVREPRGAEPRRPNAALVLSQGNLSLTASSASSSPKTQVKSKANTQVFEGYKSKAVSCTQKQKENGEEEFITSRTCGSNIHVSKQKLLSTKAAIPPSQTSAVTVSQNPMLKRKGSVPVLPRKKLRSSCHLADPANLDSFTQRSVHGPSAGPIAALALSSPNTIHVENPAVMEQNTEFVQNNIISDPNGELSVEDLVLPEWVDVTEDQSKPDLSDLLSNALPELSEFLSEDYKGDNSSSTAQTEILQNLYKALDLNVSANSSDMTQPFESTYSLPDECSVDSGDLTELLRPTLNLPDECNSIDALLSH